MITTHSDIADNTSNKLPSTYDLVYQSGSENIAWLKTCPFLNARKGIYTPATQLAQEGKVELVILLVTCGANVHEAAMGAAMGKHRALAEKLYLQYGAGINYIAKGASIARDYEYVKELLENYDADINMIAEGAGISGDLEYINKICELHVPIDGSSQNHFFYSIVKGAVISGQVDYALKLYKEKGFKYIIDIFEAAVISGNIALIEDLGKSYNVDKYLAKCAAYHGNKEYCIKLIDDNKWSYDKDYRERIIKGIFEGMSESGDILLFDDFKHYIDDNIGALLLKSEFGRNVILKEKFGNQVTKPLGYLQRFAMQRVFEDKETIQNSIKHGDFEFAISLYNNIYIRRETRQKLILSHVGVSLISNLNFSKTSLALHQLSFVNDYAFLNALKDETTVYLKNIIPDAIKINQTMKRYQLNFEEAQILLNNTKLRKLFLYMPFNLGQLIPFDAALLILTIFSPLSLKKTRDFYEKISASLNKSFLISDLEKYSSKYWVYHRERANSLLSEVKKAEDRQSIKTLIKYQKDLFDGTIKPEVDSSKAKHLQPITSNVKDEYYEIAEKNVLRLI